MHSHQHELCKPSNILSNEICQNEGEFQIQHLRKYSYVMHYLFCRCWCQAFLKITSSHSPPRISLGVVSNQPTNLFSPLLVPAPYKISNSHSPPSHTPRRGFHLAVEINCNSYFRTRHIKNGNTNFTNSYKHYCK